jgi:hypothetical protein
LKNKYQSLIDTDKDTRPEVMVSVSANDTVGQRGGASVCDATATAAIATSVRAAGGRVVVDVN